MKVQISNISLFKKQAIKWANQFEICAAYDSNHYPHKYSKFDFLIAADQLSYFEETCGNAFEQLKAYHTIKTNWLFGGIAYDLKNETENLHSKNPDHLHFPDIFFFEPKHLLILKGNTLEIISKEAEKIYQEINNFSIVENLPKTPIINIHCRFSREDYLQSVKNLQAEISNGNIYETNFCIEFYSKNTTINPLAVYQKLAESSPTPFSNYFKWFDKYIIGASPERYLFKQTHRLISQPIKGTIRRGKDEEEDKMLKNKLFWDAKERQENVMIVDLVRNDLTKSAIKGSVKVEELFGIYSFKQVHQMISTVVCEVEKHTEISDILKNTFPMGSMTGAPKIKAMELIEDAEKSKRSMFSGAIGYISPEKDFDFNVVIRSILYNSTNKYLSFQAGSAITYYANPEKEYEECMLKISAILKALNGKLA